MKRLAILLLLLCAGCACKNDDIPLLEVRNPMDKHLNCANLHKEMVIAQFEIKANLSREDAMPAYAKNITCLFATRLHIEKAKNMAENRVKYLQMLMQEKGCIGKCEGPVEKCTGQVVPECAGDARLERVQIIGEVIQEKVLKKEIAPMKVYQGKAPVKKHKRKLVLEKGCK